MGKILNLFETLPIKTNLMQPTIGYTKPFITGLKAETKYYLPKKAPKICLLIKGFITLRTLNLSSFVYIFRLQHHIVQQIQIPFYLILRLLYLQTSL